MDKLSQTGFYTLEDKRAKNCSQYSPLWRCELILTERCNFYCNYCRGINKKYWGDMSKEDAFNIIDMWSNEGLKNVRFSGGEPMLWPYLLELVKYTKKRGCKRIAISTNGSATLDEYKKLIDAGINDISISFDSCCATTTHKMSGRIGVWGGLIENIKELSKLTYVTAGVVLTEDNFCEVEDIVKFATFLNVSDIRLIPAAQNGKILPKFYVDDSVLNKYPILKYRLNNLWKGKSVRGLSDKNNYRCPLVLDDMAVIKNYHYPCIIYLREQGEPIGKISSNVRQERQNWYSTHKCYDDPICRDNCLDVCIDYNNRVLDLQR